MANLVAQLITQTKSLLVTTLGATYQELPFIYEVAKNNERTARLAYGVRPLSAATSEGVLRAYTLDHSFEIILTDTYARGASDSQKETALSILYDKADAIFKVLVNTKINLSSIVLNVFDPALSEPEFLDDSKFIVLRMQYRVKYRSALT